MSKSELVVWLTYLLIVMFVQRCTSDGYHHEKVSVPFSADHTITQAHLIQQYRSRLNQLAANNANLDLDELLAWLNPTVLALQQQYRKNEYKYASKGLTPHGSVGGIAGRHLGTLGGGHLGGYSSYGHGGHQGSGHGGGYGRRQGYGHRQSYGHSNRGYGRPQGYGHKGGMGYGGGGHSGHNRPIHIYIHAPGSYPKQRHYNRLH